METWNADYYFEYWRILSNVLAKRSQLQSVGLDAPSTISSVFSDIFSNAIARNPSITHLRLSIGNLSVHSFANLLQTSTSIQHLKLTGNALIIASPPQQKRLRVIRTKKF
jgi:Ran GTPase-activating protein (RanGAP) involved in mRNA processing and transport